MSPALASRQRKTADIDPLRDHAAHASTSTPGLFEENPSIAPCAFHIQLNTVRPRMQQLYMEAVKSVLVR